MPAFRDATNTAAPPEEVWKILYDPSRFPEWWVGFETVETEPSQSGEERRYTMYPNGYPDFPMPQVLRTSRDQGRVMVSCLVSELRFEWRLEPANQGTGSLSRSRSLSARLASSRASAKSSPPRWCASRNSRPQPEFVAGSYCVGQRSRHVCRLPTQRPERNRCR